jgi:hypothetical protein
MKADQGNQGGRRKAEGGRIAARCRARAGGGGWSQFVRLVNACAHFFRLPPSAFRLAHEGMQA